MTVKNLNKLWRTVSSHITNKIAGGQPSGTPDEDCLTYKPILKSLGAIFQGDLKNGFKCPDFRYKLNTTQK